jgi:hypothetical protein
MSVREVNRPVPWRKAFGERGDAALLSQAALLLLLGAQVRGDARGPRARAAAARQAYPRRDAARFPVPQLSLTGQRVPASRVQARLRKRYGREVSRALRAEEREAAPLDVLADLAARLQRNPTGLAAAELMECCLRHPDELPRVAAAAAYFELSTDPRRSLDVLARGTRSTDDLARAVAATALARVAPEDPRLLGLTKARRRPTRRTRSRTSLLVHGTFARNTTWWQPGGEFHEYLLSQVRPDLYKAADRFEWSGGWSDAARAVGAMDLLAWVDDRNLNGLDLFTHSHGGSVAMLASQAGLSSGLLVLLSCPVHVPKYLPDFARVRNVVSIRVHLDLVILADGGGQRFQHPKIREHVLPLWFEHSATHEPDIWQRYDVPSML